jgi:hypothetical protein
MATRPSLPILLLTALPAFAALVACGAGPRDEDSSESEAALGDGPGGSGTGTCANAPAITPKWETNTSRRPLGPMVFDAMRNRLVVLGETGTSELGPNGWSAPAGDPRPAGQRAEASIAYDSARGRAVLFGGSDVNDPTKLLGDTWEWDGATNTWTQMTPAGVTPRARKGHALAYDAARQKTVLFGGIAGTQLVDRMEDTWTWDGAAWTRVGTPAGTHPEPRYGLHMTFDASRSRVVLYGQFGDWYVGPIGGPNTSKGNTWEWDGTAWTRALHGDGTFSSDDPTSLPMTYDSRRGRVVRFDVEGGRYQKTFDVLEWTGAAWSKIAAGPGPRVDVASATQYYGAYDSNRGRLELGSTAYPLITSEFLFYEEPNRAPVLAAVPDQRVFAGDTLSFTLTATDVDVNAVQYSVTPLPPGASVDPTSGAFVWSPTAADVGTYALTARASDGCADATRSFTIRVDDFAYSGLPSGAVKLGGHVSVPVDLAHGTTGYDGQAELDCVVAGQNPGKVAVTCEGKPSEAWSYQSSTTFTPTALTAAIEQDLSFSYRDGDGDALRALRGRLEPLSDGTFKLHLTGFAQPLANGDRVAMRTTPPYGTTDAYGIVDVVP